MKGYQKRIADLRSAGVIERIYKGSTPFDGEPLQFIGTLEESIEEYVAPASTYLGSGSNQFEGVYVTKSKGFVLANNIGIRNVIDSKFGEGASDKVPIASMVDPLNIEARLIQKPGTDITHVFFMPSRAYVDKLTQKFENLE